MKSLLLRAGGLPLFPPLPLPKHLLTFLPTAPNALARGSGGILFPLAFLGNFLLGKFIGKIQIDGNAASFILVALISQFISIDGMPTSLPSLLLFISLN